MKTTLRWQYTLLATMGVLMFIIIVIGFIRGNVQKPYTIGISNGYVGNNWRNQMLEDIEEAITIYKQEGLIKEVITKNAGQDVRTQILHIRDLIDSKVDLLLIDPNDKNELNHVIDEALSKGIVVVIFDQGVSHEGVYQLTINQYEWGANMTQWLVNQLGGKGQIVMVSGVKGQPCNIDRSAGMRAVLSQYPEIEVLEEVYGNWDQSTAKKVMTEVIHQYPNIDGVLSQDGMALGIIQAYEFAGKDVPVMTGETMNAFIEKSMQLSKESDYRTYALTNPPGIGASALSLGLYLLENNDQLKRSSRSKKFYFPIQSMQIYKGQLNAEFDYAGGLGTNYYDIWYDVEQIEEKFFK